MNNIFSRLWLLLCGVFISSVAAAQERPDMADLMRSNGKIYVVVAVCLLILIGLFYYVWTIDRKIKKIEDKN